MKIYLVSRCCNGVIFSSKDKSSQLGYMANKIRKDLNEHKCFNNDVRGDITQLLCQERVEEALIKYNRSIMCLLYGALDIQEIEV
jgi:hypothetical protein